MAPACQTGEEGHWQSSTAEYEEGLKWLLVKVTVALCMMRVPSHMEQAELGVPH